MVNGISSLSITSRPLVPFSVVKQGQTPRVQLRFGEQKSANAAKKEFFLVRWFKALWNGVLDFLRFLLNPKSKSESVTESPTGSQPTPQNVTPQKISHPLFHPDPKNEYSTYPGTMIWDDSVPSADAVTCQNEIRTTKPQFCQHKMVHDLRERVYTPRGTLILGYDQAGHLSLYVHRLTKRQDGFEPNFTCNSGNLHLASISPNKHLTSMQHQILRVILGTDNREFMKNKAWPVAPAISEPSNQLSVNPDTFANCLFKWDQNTRLTLPPNFYENKELTINGEREKAELYRRICKMDKDGELQHGKPGEILAVVYTCLSPVDISAYKPRWELVRGMEMIMSHST